MISEGYWWLIGLVTGFGFLIVFNYSSDEVKHLTIFDRFVIWLVRYLGAVAAMTAVFSFFGGVLLVGIGVYSYLRYGLWKTIRVIDLLYLFDMVPTKLTGWVGLDNMIARFCEWSGILVTMLVLPVVSLCIMGLLIAKAESYIKRPFTDRLNALG
jgi:hypothetical protein